jgi:RNA polymerase sigma factor (sigma-70 family)
MTRSDADRLGAAGRRREYASRMRREGLSSATDEELITLARCAASNKQRKPPLQELFGRYLLRRRMPSWVRNELRKGGPCSEAEVDDCVQAAVERLIREIRDLDRVLPTPFEIAVRAGCKYAALDQLRRRVTARERTGSVDLTEMDEGGHHSPGRRRPAVNEDDPAIEAVRSGMIFESRISSLDPEDQDIVRRRLVDDEDYDQIATRVGKTTASVRQRFSRSMKTLAEAMDTAVSAARSNSRYELRQNWTYGLSSRLRARPSKRSYRAAGELVDRALRDDG